MKLYIIVILFLLTLNSCNYSDITNNIEANNHSDINTNIAVSQELNNKVFKVNIAFSKTSGAFYNGGIDLNIVSDIKNAKKNIYMAMYDLTNRSITDALIEAHKRGIEVKVTTDNNTIYEDRYIELKNAGILVNSDNSNKSLMHNKFLVIDERVVWSGSGNYTVYSFYRNFENYIRIENITIALSYKKEFDMLYNLDSSLYRGVKYNYLEVYFSPDSKFENKIIKSINNAKISIYFLAFSFTSKNIADAIIEAKKRGLEVKGVLDSDQNDFQNSSKYEYLLENGIDVKLDSSEYKLHSKIIIIDKNITITGSYNFTNSANLYNNENSIFIKDSNITSIYINNFNYIYSY